MPLPPQETCCDLRYARATAMSTSGPSSRSTSPKCRVADYTRVRIRWRTLRAGVAGAPRIAVPRGGDRRIDRGDSRAAYAGDTRRLWPSCPPLPRLARRIL